MQSTARENVKVLEEEEGRSTKGCNGAYMRDGELGVGEYRGVYEVCEDLGYMSVGPI